MNALRKPPGFFTNLFTLGIARARWISAANKSLDHRTGFLFAYFLQAFANYGLAKRINLALRNAGSGHAESPFLCFWLTGWPFIGATRRLRRGVTRLNDAIEVGQRAVHAVPMPAA